MRRAAKFLSWCFAVGAVVFAAISLAALRGLLHARRAGTLAPARQHGALPAALVFVPAALAAVYAMAWWSTRKATAHARAWAIAASALNLLLGLAPVILALVLPAVRGRVSLGGSGWLLLVVGVAGIIVFSRREVLPASEPAARLARVPGDGTSPWVDTLVQFAGIAGVLIGFTWLGRWGEARQLPLRVGLWFWVLLAAAELTAVAGHELGHAVVGRALGMRLRSFTVGPFRWQIQEGKWTFQFQPANFLAVTGGSAGLVPTKLTDSCWPDVCMIAGGPAGSLCLGLLALWATLRAQGRGWEPAWEFLAFVAIISLISVVVNLVPIRPEAVYSDGAHIYQLLTHGPWTDVHRVFSATASSLVTPLRPKDLPAPALERAAALVPGGQRGFLLRMFAFTHFLDCGQIPEALQALDQAKTVYEQSASDVPGALLAYFVYASVFLKPDPEQARHWWELMEAKQARQGSTEYWLARTAIRWSENDPEAAREAWRQGTALAAKLPQAGAYEFDRWLFAGLRQRLEAPSPAPA